VIVTRRQAIWTGGLLLAGLAARPGKTAAGGPIEIAMNGNEDGSHVWFDPIGIHVEPGAMLRWTNRDPGNSHTVTAYHPKISGRPRRMPRNAKPWDSDYLLPDETFSLTLTEEGVYDYYCIPHEHAGMVGRIVVGGPEAIDWEEAARDAGTEPLPEIALKALPAVGDIVAKGRISRR
jgi:plastocyanin